MGNGVELLGFLFNVTTPTQASGKPEKKSIVNSFDLAADLVSLDRIEGETNADFKQRIMDASVNPGAPIYDGFVNNLTRELGFSKDRAILIELKQNSAGDVIARNPRVDVLANRVVLYSDWRPDGTAVIDKTIRTYKTTDTGYMLDGLVAAINTSSCFTASMYSGVRSNLHSSNLIRGTTDVYSLRSPIDSSNFTELVGEHIVEGSLVFEEEDIFKTEVATTPTAEGEYKVDYENGRIYPYSTPSGTLGVTYHYGLFPFVVYFSPVQFFSLQDEDFLDELFHLETLDSGEEQRGLPNKEGSEIFHQLFEETKVFWGE